MWVENYNELCCKGGVVMGFNKLVRDGIPEIIKRRGAFPVTHIANDEEYEECLKNKLREEVDEFLGDNSKEELADIMEVIYAICDFKGIGRAELELIRKRKVDERGAFDDRIVLEEVKD